MTKRYRTPEPLAEIDRSQREEIEKYKWIESQKAGKDIGWQRASQEWLDKHFAAWKQNTWQRAVAEAIDAENRWN